MAYLDRSELSAAATLAQTNELLTWQGSNVGKTVTMARLLKELGIFYVLGSSGVASPLTNPGHTNETTLATITIPAGAMGANGIIKVWSRWSGTNSANNKTARVRLGGAAGTQYLTAVTTTVVQLESLRIIQNRNNVASQVGFVAASTNTLFATNAAITTSAVNTAVSQDIIISGQLALGTESIVLESYLVELLSKA